MARPPGFKASSGSKSAGASPSTSPLRPVGQVPKQGTGEGPILLKDGRVPKVDHISQFKRRLAELELSLAALDPHAAKEAAAHLEWLAQAARKKGAPVETEEEETVDAPPPQKRAKREEAAPTVESEEGGFVTEFAQMLASISRKIEEMPPSPLPLPTIHIASSPEPTLPAMPAEWFDNPSWETLIPEAPLTGRQICECMTALGEKVPAFVGGKINREYRLNSLADKEISTAYGDSPTDPIAGLLDREPGVYWAGEEYRDGSDKIDIDYSHIVSRALHKMLFSRNRGMKYGVEVGNFPQQSLKRAALYGLRHGHVELAFLAVMQGLPLSDLQNDRSLLHQIVKQGNVAAVHWLLDHGFDINGQDSKGNTALHYAVERGYKMAELLISRGARVDVPNRDGLYLIDIVLRQPNRIFLERFVKKGVGRPPADLPAWAPILLQHAYDYLGIEMKVDSDHAALALLPPGRLAALESTHAGGDSAMMRALRSYTTPTWQSEEYGGKFDGLAVPLLDLVYGKFQPNKEGELPLHVASEKGYLSGVKRLISPELVNVQDADGETPLHKAARGGHPAVFSYLAANGARLDITNNRGKRPADLISVFDNPKPWTALLYRHGQLRPKQSILDIVLTQDPEAMDDRLLNDLVFMLGHFEPGPEWSGEDVWFARQMIRSVVTLANLRITTRNHPAFNLVPLSEIQRLRSLGVEEDGETILTRALKSGDLSSLSPLEIIVLAEVRDSKGQRPLQIAIEENCLEGVKRLVMQARVSLDAEPNSDRTPLGAALAVGGEMASYFLSPYVWADPRFRATAKSIACNEPQFDLFDPKEDFVQSRRFYLMRSDRYPSMHKGVQRLAEELNRRGPSGRTLLDLYKDDSKRVEQMIRRGANPLKAGSNASMLFPVNDPKWLRYEFRGFEAIVFHDDDQDDTVIGGDTEIITGDTEIIGGDTQVDTSSSSAAEDGEDAGNRGRLLDDEDLHPPSPSF